MTGATILLTGATGYLGRKLAEEFVGHPDTRLVLWVRARDRGKAEQSIGPLAKRTTDAVVAWGDLADPFPFAGVDPSEVTHIVHTAAITQFSAPRVAAHAVNIEGVAKLLRFARQCRRLESVTIASTLYVAGLRPGLVAAAPMVRPATFANTYEESKWLAEDLTVESFNDLPWRIIRLPTLIADDAGGAVGQVNAVHNALRLLFNGLLPVVPGRAETPLYLATAEEIVAPMVQLVQTAPRRVVANLVPDAKTPATLGRIMGAAHVAFSEVECYRARVREMPPWCDETSYAALSDAAGQFSTDLVQQAHRAIAPFARQLYVNHQVATGAAGTVLPLEHPVSRCELIARVCRNLAATRWGVTT